MARAPRLAQSHSVAFNAVDEWRGLNSIRAGGGSTTELGQLPRSAFSPHLPLAPDLTRYVNLHSPVADDFEGRSARAGEAMFRDTAFDRFGY
jgi:hypothetical protein